MEPATLAIVVTGGLLFIGIMRYRHAMKQEEARERAAPAPKKKKKKKKAAPPPEKVEPATPALPASWGWAKMHLPSAQMKALGYYYRDQQAGYSFKILVDLVEVTGDDAIREAARATSYIPSSTFRLPGHDTVYSALHGDQTREEMEAVFENGVRPGHPDCAVVVLLSAEEKKLYELPEAMPGIEIYAR